jgi:hypothetical protein
MKDSPTSGGKPASSKRAKGAPIGTHSLTGDAANVGIPSPPEAHATAEPSDQAPADHVPTPDEDGPHDVPDEKVIEKTLPSVPTSDSAGGGSEQMR